MATSVEAAPAGRVGFSLNAGWSARSVVNVGIIGFAVFTLVWSLYESWIGFRGADLDAYSTRIVAGEAFKAEALRPLRPELDQLEGASSGLRPDALRSAAIIELRLAELSITSGQSVADNPQFAQAVLIVKIALQANPLDSFLWYALFWLDKSEHGLRQDNIDDLRLSYATGPHEGWIAVHRNRDAVAILPQLPPDLQTEVFGEFRNLVASNYIDDAANILAGPGWPQRRALLDALTDLPLPSLRLFASALAVRDIPDDVPGLPKKVKKPWDFVPG